jgi:hypothetical protein
MIASLAKPLATQSARSFSSSSGHSGGIFFGPESLQQPEEIGDALLYYDKNLGTLAGPEADSPDPG